MIPNSLTAKPVPAGPAANDVPPSSGIGAAYIRVSTDDQTELSPDAQLREILQTAKADGYTIPDDFIFLEDRGRSGRRADNRPEFQRMISIAKLKPVPFQRLYLWKFSRFARNQDESTFYKGILRKKCGVEIVSVSEPIAQGMFGRLIETIIEWFDEYYSYNLSGEVLRGMTEKALRNGYQSTPSLGYDAVGGGKPFVIDEKTYPIVEFIHQSYHSGMDLTSIARAANDKGYRTRRKNPFTRRTVRGILTNEFYKGTVTWNGISFQGLHETRESVTALFDDNQERLKREYQPLSRREVSSCRHWASGLLKCSVCGASLSYSHSKDCGKRPDCFQCWKYAKGIHKGSCCVSVKIAEETILRSLQSVTGEQEIVFELNATRENTPSSQEKQFLDALTRLHGKERRIREAYEAGVDTLEEYKANKQRLRSELERIRSRQEASVRPPVHDGSITDSPCAPASASTVYGLLTDPCLDYGIKGTALRSILKKIVYDREHNEFHFYYYV